MGSLIGERVKSLRFECTGRRPVHFFQRIAVAAVALIIAAAASPAAAAPAAAPAQAQPAPSSGQSVADFYKSRAGYPLWLSPTAGDASQRLMALLSSASLDGLDPNRYNVAALQQALDAARSGKRKRVEQADQMLSAAFVAYVSDLRQDPGVAVNYVDADLKPRPPTSCSPMPSSPTCRRFGRIPESGSPMSIRASGRRRRRRLPSC